MAKPVTILIADDEEIVHRSCLRIFRDESYRMDSAYSGEEAWDRLQSESFDVMLTDLKMPGMGGMELLRRVMESTPEQVVVVFTGYATVETARAALKLGAFDYVPKPFTPEEIRAVVQNAVAASSERGERPMLDLMAVVSHDLQSPLAAMHTSMETLLQGYFGEVDESQKRILQSILRNCTYLEEIIRSYLELSEMSLEEMTPQFASIRLVKEVIEPIVPKYEENHRQMNLSTLFLADPQVQGDPHLLSVVLENLLANAVKYGRENGAITITVDEEVERALVAVRNEGVGFRQEQAARLFQKHSRLKQPGTEGVKGNGLGLYICKMVIEKHGGQIEANASPGEWAEFRFTMPK